jgi:hypothetical protein
MLDRLDLQPLFFAPFVSSVMQVEPAWIDYNGHLNMAYYNGISGLPPKADISDTPACLLRTASRHRINYCAATFSTSDSIHTLSKNSFFGP